MAADLRLAQQLYNAVEHHASERREKIFEEEAERMLELFRGALYQHNTGRHVITINSGMGMAGVWVDGIAWYDFGRTMPMSSWRLSLPIVATLNWIHDNLDWDWAAYLNGKVLNPRNTP